MCEINAILIEKALGSQSIAEELDETSQHCIANSCVAKFQTFRPNETFTSNGRASLYEALGQNDGLQD